MNKYRVYNHDSQGNVAPSMLVSKETRDKKHWHRVLGNVNFRDLKFLCGNNLVEGLPSMLSGEYINCDICYRNKMRNLSFGHNVQTRSNDVLELVHTDVNEPHNTVGSHGEKYFVIFIDEICNGIHG